MLIAALAATPTVRGAAEVAGIAERTAYRYLADAVVRAAIAERQDAALAQVTAGLVADMGEARAALVGMMKNKSAADGVRVRAALGVLDCGLRLFEMLSLADRVTTLEQLVRVKT